MLAQVTSFKRKFDMDISGKTDGREDETERSDISSRKGQIKISYDWKG